MAPQAARGRSPGEEGAEGGAYEYEYQRLESVLREQDAPGGRLVGDIALDWRDPAQREELRVWWSFAWPTMVLFFSTQSYSFIDMAFLGHFGDKSSDYLAASSQAGILFDISFAIFTRGYLQVLTVLCSQAYGAGKFELMGKWLQMCLMVCLVCGVPVAVLWWFSADVIQTLFGLDDKLRGLVQQFSRWSILRLWPQLFSGSVRQWCLAQKVIRPLVVVSVLGVLLNVALNQVLIHGVLGWEGLGFKGSPIATATTNLAVLVVTVAYVFGWREDTKKTWPGWSRDSFSLPRFKEFMRQGLPLTLATCLEDFQIQAISAMAIKLAHDYDGDGSWIIGTHNGLLSFFLSIMAFQWGVMKATSVRSAHYIGGRDAMHAKLVAKMAFVVSVVVSIISGAGLMLFRHKVGYLFSNDVRIADEAAKLCAPLSVAYIALAFFYISMAMLDSQGRPGVVAVGFAIGAWGVSVPLAYLLGITLSMGLMGLWLGLLGGYAVITFILCYYVVTTDWHKVLDDAELRNSLGNDDTPAIISADLNPFPSPLLASPAPSTARSGEGS